jgi:hypothetical protein
VSEDVISGLEAHVRAKELTMREALEKYELIETHYDPVNGSFLVMAERDPKMSVSTSIREFGYTSMSPWTAWTRDERVSELRDKTGIRTYYDMKRADGTVRGALRLVKTPIMAARWFVEPASDSTIDKNIADFVDDCLFTKMNVPWSRVIEDALCMCEYGYFPLEKVFRLDADGKVRLAKLAPRHPLDVREWVYDVNGGPNGIIMEATEATGWETVEIPIEKMIVFVLEQEGGDMRGISLLRSAYKHYYYKDTLYKIDAIQKERHGIGVPIIKLPLGFSEEDKRVAEDLGRNLRTNERAHIVAPENWTIEFAKLEGQPVDCLPSIKHHDDRIMTNILAPFYDDSTAKEDSMSMFFKATRYIASTVSETFNHFLIPQLVDFNFARGGYPKLRARRIGEYEDLRTMSFAFRNFVGAGAVQPDDVLEAFLRREMDLPPADEATKRLPPAPQAPGAPSAPEPAPVGPPRQSPKPATGSGRSNSGRDASGG